MAHRYVYYIEILTPFNCMCQQSYSKIPLAEYAWFVPDTTQALARVKPLKRQ